MSSDDRRPDWRTMTRETFDTAAAPGALFALAPGQVVADDQHGTGDLFGLLADTGA